MEQGGGRYGGRYGTVKAPGCSVPSAARALLGA